MMATTACLGMLQYAAARGSYRGFSLFATDQKRGRRIGAGLTVGAVLAYVLFAPEILTPGPAGSEVAAMFAICALEALAVTLLGADVRLRRGSSPDNSDGEEMLLGDLSAILYRPLPSPKAPCQKKTAHVPAIVLLSDPSGFFVPPNAIVEALCKAGMAVLVLDVEVSDDSNAPLSRQALLGHAATALSYLNARRVIDRDCTGLLGLGLGADIALQVAAADGQLKAVMGVAPIALAPLKPGATAPGLFWLRELSYRQIWGWRRRWPTLQRAAAQLDLLGQAVRAFPAAQNSPQEDVRILAMRSNSRTVEPLPVPGKGYFALLDDERTCRLIVQWFQKWLHTDE